MLPETIKKTPDRHAAKNTSHLGAVMCLLFFLLLAGTFFLVRSGRIGGPPWAGRPGSPPWAHRNAPEADAKRILAERFANGDISSDEFMERASVLNWTPGSDSQDPGRGGGWKPKKRR
jgi:putative membrane protein